MALSSNLVTEDMKGKRVSVFMMSGVKNVGRIESVDDELVSISFTVENRDKSAAGERKEMNVTLRQDRVESVGVLS